MSDGKVVIDTRLDDTGLNKDLNSISTTTQNKTKQTSKKVDNIVNKSTTNTQKKVKKTAKEVNQAMEAIKASLASVSAILAAAFSVKALFGLGKEAVALSSDLQEVQNVVETAFEDMSYKIEEFSKKSIENFGMSELSAKRMASTFTSMGRGMGQSLGNATDAAVELTGRLGDVASFYNLTLDEVNTLGRAIYSGESEPLKRVGIIMTENQLAAYALSQGYSKLYKNMSAAEKLQVRQAYFLQQTSLAAGDFAKTSNSWANQTRILSERWKQFLQILGNGLVQVLTPILNGLNQMMSYLITGTKSLMKMLGVKGMASEAAKGIADVSTSIDDVTESTEAAIDAQKELLGEYDELSVINQDSDTGATTAPTLISTEEGPDLGEMNEQAQTSVGIFGYLKEILVSIGDYFTRFGPMFSNIYTNYISPFVSSCINLVSSLVSFIHGILEPFLPAISVAFDTIITWLGDLVAGSAKILTGIIDIFSGILDFITGIFTGDWEKAWEGLKEIVKGVFETLWGIFKFTIGALVDIVTGVISVVVEVFKVGISFIGGLFKSLGTLFNNIASLLVGVFKGAWDGLKNGAQNAWNAICSVFRGFADFFGNIFSAAWGKIKAVFTEGGVIFKNITNGILTVFKGIVNSLITGINNVIAVPFKAINSVLEDIADVSIMGVKPFDWLPTLPVPKIPKLATGAVIPPNKEFMAILGDQKSGTNIETPLSTMIEAFRTALDERGSSDKQPIQLTLNGRVVAEAVWSEEEKRYKQTGSYKPSYS